MELIVDESLGGGAWFTGNRIAPHPVPQNGVHVAHDYASGGVRACRPGVRASARVTEALAAVRDIYRGGQGRAPMTGGAACCYSNCSRISSAMFLGEDWKIGCRREEGVDFLKIVVYRIMIGWSSFRVDWMIYTTLNLKNCIDILQSLFSKRNLLINNGETTLNF